MKGVHKKDGGEKSRQTWRKTVREKERKEEGEKGMHGRWIERLRKGERQTWRKRERERWRRKGKHREKKRPGEKKTVGWKKKDGWRKGTETREKDRAAV